MGLKVYKGERDLLFNISHKFSTIYSSFIFRGYSRRERAFSLCNLFQIGKNKKKKKLSMLPKKRDGGDSLFLYSLAHLREKGKTKRKRPGQRYRVWSI
jgi:hypothetical protein